MAPHCPVRACAMRSIGELMPASAVMCFGTRRQTSGSALLVDYRTSRASLPARVWRCMLQRTIGMEIGVLADLTRGAAYASNEDIAGCTRYFPGFYRIANGRLSNRISQPPSTQQGGTCAASVHPPPIHSMASTRLFTRYNLSKPEDERVRARCPYFSLHLPYDSHPSASSVSAIQPTHALPLSTRLSKLSRAQASVPLTTMLDFTVAASSSTSSSASADAPFPNQHHPRPTNKQRGGSLSFAVCVPSPAE
ncbi:hypothetical protein C8J57DRAFT_1509143 [Mycena rebaudengoi]|nr:hypothetical protein C8J57DRAFT_1509143 [Mycena rebaudengoi]